MRILTQLAFYFDLHWKDRAWSAVWEAISKINVGYNILPLRPVISVWNLHQESNWNAYLLNELNGTFAQL